MTLGIAPGAMLFVCFSLTDCSLLKTDVCIVPDPIRLVIDRCMHVQCKTFRFIVDYDTFIYQK